MISEATLPVPCAAGSEHDHPAWTQLLDPAFLQRAKAAWHSGRLCLEDRHEEAPEAATWNRHWLHLQDSTAGRLFSFYRRQIRSRCVARRLTPRLPSTGVFVECGCGSGETSSRLRPAPGQTFLALDFARQALRQAIRQPGLSGGLQADIRSLPFRDESLDVVWNLGVMEHFVRDEQLIILREFHRVLKPGGQLLLWWPPPWSADQLALSAFGTFFPPEPGRLSGRDAVGLARAAGFHNARASPLPDDCLTQLLVSSVK